MLNANNARGLWEQSEGERVKRQEEHRRLREIDIEQMKSSAREEVPRYLPMIEKLIVNACNNGLRKVEFGLDFLGEYGRYRAEAVHDAMMEYEYEVEINVYGSLEHDTEYSLGVVW